jgi:hypothetical protein
MPDSIHVIPELPDPAQRRLARAIRTHAISRQAALEALQSWRGAVAFDGPERLVLEALYDDAENLDE